MSTALNDNSHLTYTQELRRKLVDQFMVDGVYPNDPKMLTIMLGALKDHDKVTLTLKRLDADKENGDADRQALQQFQRISGMTGSKDYARVDVANDNDTGRFNPADIPVVELVPGELEVGSGPIDYNELMDRMEKEHSQSLA